jgi:glycosyltransferase involved in cell wall biosynthesis
VPAVSVIIPTSNRVESLKRALSSAMNQTLHDFEIIVVNDGSADRTSEYLASIKASRFHYSEFTENRGGSAARNEGIRMAQGDFVAFLDDDDVWEKTKLEEQVNAINRENAGLCYTGVTKRTFGGRIKRYIFMKPRFENPVKSIMSNNFFGSTSSVMVRKELLEKAEGFDPALPAMQDWDLFIRLLENGCSFYGIDRSLVYYDIADNSRNISGSFKRYKAAEEHVRRKYSGHEFFPLLNRRMIFIECTRHIKSRTFLLDSIRYYYGQLFKH